MTQNQVLLISGIDPTGKAGLLRDVEACLRLDQDYISLPTALTSQSQTHFLQTNPTNTDVLDSLWNSFDLQNISAIKIGMLANLEIASYLVQKIKTHNLNIPIVLDPVLKSSSGGTLLDQAGASYMVEHLFPLVEVVTPNAEEACQLLNINFDKNLSGQELCLKWQDRFGTTPSLYLKGGHLKEKSKDWFLSATDRFELTAEISEKTIRGSGCLFATALACFLADGSETAEACEQAKFFLKTYFS